MKVVAERMTQQPNKDLFLKLIQEHKRIIYKICHSYCAHPDDREDLAQEIVYNVWKGFPGYQPAYKFSTWMYRIALNVAISFYRKDNKPIIRNGFSENLMVFDVQPDVEVENNIRLLQKFIGELKDIDKSIMLLYLDEKTHRDIAEITGITESNVATKINRIKEKLKIKFQNIQK